MLCWESRKRKVVCELNGFGKFWSSSKSRGAETGSSLAEVGGTTARADLRSVRVLTRTESGTTAAAYDLRDVLDHGSRAPVTIKAGDIVVVLPKGANVWSGLVAVLSVSRDLLNVAVLVDYLNNRQGN